MERLFQIAEGGVAEEGFCGLAGFGDEFWHFFFSVTLSHEGNVYGVGGVGSRGDNFIGGDVFFASVADENVGGVYGVRGLGGHFVTVVEELDSDRGSVARHGEEEDVFEGARAVGAFGIS